MILLLLAAAALPATPPPPAALAAGQPADRLRRIVVEAIRNCPKGAPGEIVVCSRDRGVAEAYRLPRLDPRFARGGGAGPRLEALAGAGAGGTGSCTTSGAGGSTGCTRARIDDWAAARRAAADGAP